MPDITHLALPDRHSSWHSPHRCQEVPLNLKFSCRRPLWGYWPAIDACTLSWCVPQELSWRLYFLYFIYIVHLLFFLSVRTSFRKCYNCIFYDIVFAIFQVTKLRFRPPPGVTGGMASSLKYSHLISVGS